MSFNTWSQEEEDITPPPQSANQAELNAKISDTLQELQNMDKTEQTEVLNKLNVDQKSMVDALIKDNPFSKMSRDEVKAVLVQRAEGQRFEALFKKYPHTLEFTAELLQDKEALSKFISITAQPDKMKKYGIIMICLFIVSFFLNFKNKAGTLMARIGKKMLISGGMLAFSLLSFYYLFKTELTPSVEIFKRHFF